MIRIVDILVPFKKRKAIQAFLFLVFVNAFTVQAQKKIPPPSPVKIKGNFIQLVKDSLGNQLPDFSYCGYKASADPIQSPSILILLKPEKGKDKYNIQKAIDQLALLPLNEQGFRGTIKLAPGNYFIDGSINLHSSGIVIAGSGMQNNPTTLIGTATDRMPLIHVKGRNDNKLENAQTVRHNLLAGSGAIQLEHASAFKEGNPVVIQIKYKSNWITKLGTDHFGGGITAIGWKPGERDLVIERYIRKIEGNTLHLDVAIPVFVDTADAIISIVSSSRSDRIQQVGIENIFLSSLYNIQQPFDEDHVWDAIVMEYTQDAWVRRVQFKNFAGSAVRLLPSTSRITVEDCISIHPVSEIGGQRRFTFYTEGQQTLFQRCYAEEGYHDFGVGFATPGPNAFVQCYSKNPFSFSGTIQSWSPGVLFDNVSVEGQAIRFGFRGQDGDGAGWTTGNSLIWQSTASLIQCDSTPNAQNFAFGTWAQFSGNGYWEQSNEHIQPRSFFYAQWQQRLNKPHPQLNWMLPKDSEASSSPSKELAAVLANASSKAYWTLHDWILYLDKQYPLSWTEKIIALPEVNHSNVTVSVGFSITNGWLTNNGSLAIGRRMEVPWWSGGVNPKDIASAKPHITRFVPGRTGTGFTDLLPDVVESMKRTNTIMLEHNYGLWYERRRDDHERIKRMDGDVWPPFYELPFARSGKEKAWDGLSKYDLTTYNKWYWGRLMNFAELASLKGKWLFHQYYFQHNILEAGAHYADFPWRSANNINNTEMPEPVPYAGDKRIFVDHLFYDTTNVARKAIHKAFIKQSYQSLAANANVVHAISAEYTGPFAFTYFWLNEITKLRKKTDASLVALSVTKDVQDSLLKEKRLSRTVDIIDIRYWYLQANGTYYAPRGGEHLAPRQHARLLKPSRPSWNSVKSSVMEYRKQYPEKAVLYSADGYDQFGWAVLFGGGSMPVLPATTDIEFLKAIVATKPVYGSNLLESKKDRMTYLEKGDFLKDEWIKSAVDFSIIDISSGMVIEKITDWSQRQNNNTCVIWIKY